GIFNGVLCAGGLCPTDPLKKSTGIGAKNVIILSGSSPVVTYSGGAALAGRAMTINGSITIDLWIRDVNGNPMPGGTTIAASSSGAGLTVGQPNTDRIPCSAMPAGQEVNGITRFQYVLTSGNTAGTGTFTVTVTTPKGVVTRFSIQVTVS
ncbi:MAG TPA: hypothetical protein VKO83_02675, partial [Steroidobacteraceae bacterium]|nr:hypothetical protein [Steroidobacteraceae bacterium]